MVNYIIVAVIVIVCLFLVIFSLKQDRERVERDKKRRIK